MRLAARVRDEQVGAAVAAVVLRGDAHAGVRVGDAVAAPSLDEAEAERRRRGTLTYSRFGSSSFAT